MSEFSTPQKFSVADSFPFDPCWRYARLNSTVCRRCVHFHFACVQAFLGRAVHFRSPLPPVWLLPRLVPCLGP